MCLNPDTLIVSTSKWEYETKPSWYLLLWEEEPNTRSAPFSVISLFTSSLVSSSLILSLPLPACLHHLDPSSTSVAYFLITSIVFVFLLSPVSSLLLCKPTPPPHDTHDERTTRTSRTHTRTYLFAHPSDIDEWSLAEMTTSLLMLSRDTAEDRERDAEEE